MAYGTLVILLYYLSYREGSCINLPSESARHAYAMTAIIVLLRRAMLRVCNHRALHADVLPAQTATRAGHPVLPALNKFWIPDRVGVASLFPVAEMLPHYRGVEQQESYWYAV
jgi:hypothetical protein